MWCGIPYAEGNYDFAVETATKAACDNGWCLIADTSTRPVRECQLHLFVELLFVFCSDTRVMQEYVEIPTYAMTGYMTIFYEIEQQMQNLPPVTHVFVQAGNGGLAACISYFLAEHMHSRIAHFPKIVIVEPLSADCLLESARAGQIRKAKGDQSSIMAGLNVGIPSLVSWPVLRDAATAFLAIHDDWTRESMRLLRHPVGETKQKDPVIVSGWYFCFCSFIIHRSFALLIIVNNRRVRCCRISCASCCVQVARFN